MTVTDAIWSTVLECYEAGLSVWPPKEDGTKAPHTELAEVDGEKKYIWKHRTKERATLDELKALYANGRTGAGIIPGEISGKVEALECEESALYDEFKQIARATGLGDLLERVEAGWCDITPGSGVHLYYRCSEVGGNTKLAKRPKRLEEMQDPKDKVKTLWETRGEGGFVIIGPTNGRVHPTGKPYVRLRGGPSTIATITSEEREALFELARSFDEMPKQEVSEQSAGARERNTSGDRPGDVFNRTASWEDTGLYDKGWQRAYTHGGTTYLRRPGKRQGVSATLNYAGSDLFYCFSTSTEFESERGYSKFAVYTILNHNGDFTAAASELARRDYTVPAPRAEDSSVDGVASDGKKQGGTNEQEPRKSQATLLVEMAERQGLELWHTPDGSTYGSIPVGDHLEHWELKTKGFRGWLARLFYTEKRAAPGAQALQDALGVLEGRALYEGQEAVVHLRVARHGDTIYLDLVDADWRAIRITAQEWEVVNRPPVRFKRTRSMLPLPEPKSGGNLADLWDFINLQDRGERALVLAYTVAALRPEGPYIILDLVGEQGTAKTTAARLVSSLIDPSTTAIRSEPRNGQDLIIAASNSWMPTFDNLSKLPDWLSDGLCRLSTGGVYTTRELFTTGDEAVFEAQRPVITTSIEGVATRGDILDRTVRITLAPIPEEMRRAESRLWADFEERRPYILGALLTAVSTAMRNLPTTTLDKLPRMADFALWATAAEPALGLARGEFMEAYRSNREDVSSHALDAEPVADKLMEFISKQPLLLNNIREWWGTASNLLRELNALTSESEQKREGWPKRANNLSGALRRVAPNLRRQGVDVQFVRSGSKGRQIHLVRTGTQIIDTIVTTVTPERESAPISDDQRRNSDDAGVDGDDAISADQVPFERPSVDGVASVDSEHTYSNADFEDEEDDGFIPF